VRGKRPEDVLLPADLAEAQAAGIYVLEAAYSSFVDQLFQADHGWVVLEDVADEEDLLLGFPLSGQGRRFVIGQRQRLFDKAVFAGIEDLCCQCMVLAAGAEITTALIAGSERTALKSSVT